MSKLNGQMPFKYDYQDKCAKQSTRDTLISIIFGSVVCVLVLSAVIFIYVQQRYLYSFDSTPKFILLFVNYIELIFIFVRIFCVFYGQIQQRNLAMFLINEGFWLYNHLAEDLYPDGLFLDQKCSYIRSSKCVSIIVQTMVVLMGVTINTPDRIELGLWQVICLAIFSYVYMLAILDTTVFFAKMLVALQFYRHLNRRVRKIVHKVDEMTQQDSRSMKMQMCCDLSDQIDRIAIMYELITKYVNNLNDWFTMQLVVCFVNAFLVILCEVRCTNELDYIPLSM